MKLAEHRAAAEVSGENTFPAWWRMLAGGCLVLWSYQGWKTIFACHVPVDAVELLPTDMQKPLS